MPGQARRTVAVCAGQGVDRAWKPWGTDVGQDAQSNLLKSEGENQGVTLLLQENRSLHGIARSTLRTLFARLAPSSHLRTARCLSKTSTTLSTAILTPAAVWDVSPLQAIVKGSGFRPDVSAQAGKPPPPTSGRRREGVANLYKPAKNCASVLLLGYLPDCKRSEE